MSKAVLIDTTRCIGCRSCQVSCKQWNGLPAEVTHIEGHATAYQNPSSLSARTLTMVTYKEVEDPAAVGGLRWIFAKRQCMHCLEPACASACPVTALRREASGAVTYDADKCMGCRYCVWACPFGIPSAEWNSLAPKIKKCTMCFDRCAGGDDAATLNGQPTTPEARERIRSAREKPACVKACPTGALVFGDRGDLIGGARERIKAAPGRYVNHIYGEKEVGGTSVLYLAAIPFERMGFRTDLGERSYPSHSKTALEAVAPAVIGVGGLLTGIYLLRKRAGDVASAANGKKE